MTQTIDISLLKEMMQIMRPEPVAPVAPVLPIAPLEYNKANDNVIGMAKDIEYLRGTVDRIEKNLDKMTETHVTNADFNELVKTKDASHADHENRIRNLETSTTKILVWGSVILVLLTIAQFVLKLTGN